MINKNRHKLMLLRNGSHYLTRVLGARFPDYFPFIFITGFPKSGTTWAGQIVADYFRLPFPRGSLFPIGCPAVIHTHDTPLPRHRQCVYCIRDGRDVLVSLYFHITRRLPEGDNPTLSRRQSEMLPGLVNKNNVRDNLPGFLDKQLKRPYSTKLNWGRHVQAFYDTPGREGLTGVRYEDLLENSCVELARVISELSGEQADEQRVRWAVEKYSFEKQSGRERGEEDRKGFLRKGQAGDWVNHFTREAAEIFDHHCGDALVRAGYEADRNWIDRYELPTGVDDRPPAATT